MKIYSRITVPLLHSSETSTKMMLHVALALVPGIAVLTWAFGISVLVQIAIATLTTIVAESLMMVLRGKSLRAVFDGSGLVTAILLAISLPPALPWWMIVVGTLFAIVLVKHLYGGLGNNIFNPAMMGYVALIISFPKEMTSWASIGGISELSLSEQFFLAFNPNSIDTYTGATPLGGVKDALNQGIGIAEHLKTQSLGFFAIKNWEYINLAFLAGGLYLILARVITWHIPLVLLVSFALIASVFNLIDPQAYLPATFHLFAGGAMLGAFFIATDPVTGCASIKGKIVFAIMVGSLEYLIRTFGGYPDGIAFAVVIANIFVPLIDYYTGSRVKHED